MDELSDKAWSLMRETLDREMPVKSESDSRKPVVFWWLRWAAAAILVGLLGLLWLWPTVSADREIPVAVSSGDLPEEAVTDREASNTVVTIDKVSPNSKNNSASAATAGRIKQQRTGTDSHHTTGTSMDRKAEERVIGSLENEMPVAVDRRPEDEREGKINAGLSTLNTSDQENDATFGPAFDEFNIELEPRHKEATAVVVFPELDGFSPKAISPLDLEPLPLNRISHYDPKRPRFVHPEINAGLIAATSAGNLPGLMVEFRSGLLLHDAGRWTFQTGAGLHLQQDPFSVKFRRSGSNDLLSEQHDANAGNGGNANDPQPVASISQAVESRDVHLTSTYFDVPILFDWQFSRHFAVAAGGRMSWLLRSRWKSLATAESLGFSSDDYSLSLGNSRGLSIYQVGANNSTTTFVLNKFYASATVGFTYRPTARWNVRLQYQHSMTNQLESSVYEKTDRSFWLSAGLRF